MKFSWNFLDVAAYEHQDYKPADLFESAGLSWYVLSGPALDAKLDWSPVVGDLVRVPLIPYRTYPTPHHIMCFGAELVSRAIASLTPTDKQIVACHIIVGAPIDINPDPNGQSRVWLGIAVAQQERQADVGNVI